MGNSINDIHFEDFQNVVSDLLMRNRSILDIISKIQTSSGRVNRAVSRRSRTADASRSMARSSLFRMRQIWKTL